MTHCLKYIYIGAIVSLLALFYYILKPIKGDKCAQSTHDSNEKETEQDIGFREIDLLFEDDGDDDQTNNDDSEKSIVIEPVIVLQPNFNWLKEYWFHLIVYLFILIISLGLSLLSYFVHVK